MAKKQKNKKEQAKEAAEAAAATPENGLEVDTYCLSCGRDLTQSELYQQFRVCPSCQFHYSLSARERIRLLSDAGTFKETNRNLAPTDRALSPAGVFYRERLAEARKRTEMREAVVTGICEIDGNRVMLIVLDFGFMAGSMSCAVGEKVVMAFERARRKSLPVISVVGSGGPRVHEGVLSLMQMARTVAAAKRHHRRGLPYISVLTSPTTGEVYSSFANLGDIIVAEPKALIGFAPLRVVEQATGKPLPEGTHTAEHNLEHGLLDYVVDRTRLRELLATILDLLESKSKLIPVRSKSKYKVLDKSAESAWQRVQLARHQQRPTSLDYISRITTSFVELHGDRIYGDDAAVVCGLAELGGEAVVIVAQERGHLGETGRHQGLVYPEGFRKAQRAIRLAAKFHLSVIAFIDTPGAYSGLEAEERGTGNAIANLLAEMSDIPVPVIAVVIGEGGSEGALAFGIADRILMLENAIYSVLPPERAAVLIYRDASRAEEVAPALRLTAYDCLELGVVDVVVAEPEGGAHRDPDEASRQLAKSLVAELVQVQSVAMPRLLGARYKKFRRMGRRWARPRRAIMRGVIKLQEYLYRRFEDLREHLPSRAKPSPPKPDDTGEEKAG